VVVISGASRGLGQAVASHRLDQGDIVCGLSRRPSEFVERALGTPDLAGRFLFEAVDLTNREAILAFVHRVVERFRRIDALINNAGVVHDGLLALSPLDDIDETVDTNLRGALHLTRACLRPMLAAGRGRIINISSVAGQRGYSGLAAYASTKAALDGLTRALAREVGPRGITANSIAPGYLELGMSEGLSNAQRLQILNRTPLRRLGTPRDILAAVDFFLSPGAAFTTGQVLVIDGGLST
jgi:3-oxoacyl-[acyl-carrier protein] reductase